MAKNYQWKNTNQLISGGYVGEETGIIDGSTSWQTTSATSGTSVAKYYFRDSDFADNARSSRVVLTLTDAWTVSIDNRNYMTVTLNTVVNSIVRDDLRGDAQGTTGRSMFIRHYKDGAILWQVLNDPINTAHTILGSPLSLGSYTFTLPPGEDATRTSIYFRSNTTGHDSDVPPSTYVDEMYLGTSFKNILPKDYRPGMILDANGVWQSHNRDSGAANILKANSSWQEMRTQDGASGTDNPPLIRHSSGYKNMRNIGANG